MKFLKKAGALLIGAAVAVSCAAMTASAEETVLFEDNFDGSKESSWTQFWGDWTFGGEEGGLSVTTADSTQDWPKIITGVDEGWTDYVIEMDLENVAEGGVIFRSNNPVAGPDGFGGYYIGYDSAYMFAGMDDNGTWKILPDDGPEAPAAAALPYAVSMHWKIVVQGDTFTAYVDDMNTPFVQVQDGTYAQGGVGVRFHVLAGDTSGSVKNLKIYQLDETAGTVSSQEESSKPESSQASSEPASSEPASSQAAVSSQEAAGNADSGDSYMMWVWIGVGVVAAAGIIVAAVVVSKKKRK